MLRFFILFIVFFNTQNLTAADKPYHHLSNGTFRNPEGSPKIDPDVKWSYKIFNAERKKIKINLPEDHVIPSEEVLKNLEKLHDVFRKRLSDLA